ncbi:MAG: hypothetical protein Q9184_004562 [Pyrenodesmia sp. 2 TL-2023]
MVSSPTVTHPTSAMRNAPENASSGGRPSRSGSTPGMDALADLASMQHHQQITRANAGGLRSTEIYDSQGSTNPAALSSVHGAHGSLPARGSLDPTMAEISSRTAPARTFTTKNLSEDELQTVAELVTYLVTNSFAYESHVKLIDLLHRGFQSHAQNRSSSSLEDDPRSYDLLADLRSARESMDARFAVGERSWVDWIEDEKLLATTFDECFAVMELCIKAVQEEPGSTKLWSLYANWMTSLYVAATGDNSIREAVQPSAEILTWSDEDRMVAAGVWDWHQQMMNVWSRAARATRWRVDESHLLWDPHTELLLQALARSPSSDGVLEMKDHFRERLKTPHAEWDSTFQRFSNFTSRYEDHAYEEIMAKVNQECSTAKAMYEAREMRELAVKRSGENDNNDARLSTFSEYIEWELGQSRKKHASVFELVEALYQRALLSCPANTELWQEYTMFVTEEIVSHSRQDEDILPALDRSTRHCPWSGSLWSQYLLAAERQKVPFPDIGEIKHKATSTGLLDDGGLEEVLQVYVAWCSILRRRAFQEESTDEDLDVAEVGIRSAIEDMQRLGQAKYGKDYQGDPNYRLERIYITYFTQSGDWHRAREIWKRLIRSRGDSHEFWLRYYLWEMSAWGKISYRENINNAPSSPRPSEATKVLRTALKTPNLDWPERLIQVLQYHCEDHEDAAEIQSASVQIWKAKKAVEQRRIKEMEDYQAIQAAQAQSLQQVHSLEPQTSVDSAVGLGTSKRKRDDEDKKQGEGSATKKTRVNAIGRGAEDEATPQTTSSELKRDRENSTIIIKNLPRDATETRVRQFFRDCGTVNSLSLAVDEKSETATATMEFQSRDDALTAQTKDKKDFDGREIEIQVGSGTTLFVTNFPADADETWLRERFRRFGEITDVRLPSLKYNTHRRFCYIQYRTADQAKSATELDGEEVGSKLKLVVKISDPKRRQERVGPLQEGREIHIRGLDWAVTESDLEAVFSKYGTVEHTRIPHDVSGKSKGFAFVVFSTSEQAKAALDLNNTKLRSRIMTVTIASKAAAKRQATTIIQSAPRSTMSPSPDVTTANGDHHSNAASPPSSMNPSSKPRYAEIRDRTVALLNIPDTVNDARIRALVEPYGPLVKIVLRPDHQGAEVEFKNVSDAGKAALGIDGHEITPGRSLRVGTVGELRKQKAEKRRDKFGGNDDPKRNTTAGLQSNVPIGRPRQIGISRGRGGGLGVKRDGANSIIGLGRPQSNEAAANHDSKDTSSAQAGQAGQAKSNADFRNMMLAGKGIPNPVNMHIHFFYICTYLLPLLPSLVAALVLHPQTNLSQALSPAKFPGITDHGGGLIDAPASTWCRPRESELDLLFTTRGGQLLRHIDVMYVIGIFREVAQEKVKEDGRMVRVGRKSLRIDTRDVVVTIFDERMEERTWGDMHDVLDILLLCVYMNKVSAEMTGTFFNIEAKTRLAGVMIKKGRLGDGGGDVAAF